MHVAPGRVWMRKGFNGRDQGRGQQRIMDERSEPPIVMFQ